MAEVENAMRNLSDEDFKKKYGRDKPTYDTPIIFSCRSISNPVPYFTLKNRQVTIFAPTNEAFQRYSGTLDESLVLYHMSKSRYNMFITISSHSVQLHYNLAYAFRLICNIAVNYYLG